MKKMIDLTGRVFGRWTVLGIDRTVRRRVSTSALWKCRCVCGAERSVEGGNLRSGASKSCGCYSADTTAQRMRTHGLSGSREYNIWCKMRARCCDPRNKQFPDWGGRGISVCERWSDFSTFLEDMGACPTPRHSIDRIDNSGNYEPSNCRWATPLVQANNSRWNRNLTFNGETMSMTQWARKVGMNAGTLWDRLRKGWPMERALGQPVRGARCL